MNVSLKPAGVLVLALAFAACSANGGPSSVPATTGQSSAGAQSHGITGVPVCPGRFSDRAQCTALVRTDIPANPDTPAGVTPADLESAYNLPSASKGKGQIVAIVDAYDNPDVAKDLATYRTEFSLGKANFTKYNQKGQQKNYPSGNVGWGLEIDLDVEMVSASCPHCTIYLIEANSDYFSDLGAAEREAVKLGANIVSNSYDGSCSGTCGYGSDYDTHGVTYLASAGDQGYGIGAPAQFDSVVSVGGTQLIKDSSSKRGWTEIAWNGTGAGCSTVAKPSWQHDPGCSFRTANDVAADASENSAVAEYDSYSYGGWIEVYGTSVSSPLLGGVFGLAGNSTKQDGGKTFWTLSKKNLKKDLYAVTSGSDGSCTPTYLCTDGTKEYKSYGGPTGWGTPNGIGAF